MSFGKMILIMIIIYYVVKSAVKRGMEEYMEEYFATVEAKKYELIVEESEK